MKKLLFAAALIAFASSAWAQDVAKTNGRVIGPDAGARKAGNDGCCLFVLRIGDARHGCAAREGERARGDVERTGRTWGSSQFQYSFAWPLNLCQASSGSSNRVRRCCGTRARF